MNAILVALLSLTTPYAANCEYIIDLLKTIQNTYTNKFDKYNKISVSLKFLFYNLDYQK